VPRAVAEPLIRRWTRREYDRLIELDLLHEDEPIELLAGRRVVREPRRTPHAVATQLGAEALRTDRVLEVHRAPTRPSPGRRPTHAEVRRMPASAAIAPLAAPAVRIVVADLLA
jgi:hypothetical protein